MLFVVVVVVVVARGNLALDLVTHRDLARSNTVSDLFSAPRTRINSEGYQ